MNRTLTGTTTLSQSGPGSNGSEELVTAQIYRTGALTSDAV